MATATEVNTASLHGDEPDSDKPEHPTTVIGPGDIHLVETVDEKTVPTIEGGSWLDTTPQLADKPESVPSTRPEGLAKPSLNPWKIGYERIRTRNYSLS